MASFLRHLRINTHLDEMLGSVFNAETFPLLKLHFHHTSHETGTSSQLVPVHDDLLYCLIDVSLSDLISITYTNIREQNKGLQKALFLLFITLYYPC